MLMNHFSIWERSLARQMSLHVQTAIRISWPTILRKLLKPGSNMIFILTFNSSRHDRSWFILQLTNPSTWS